MTSDTHDEWNYIAASVFFPVGVTGRQRPMFPTRAQSSVEADEPHTFANPAAMANASDLVLTARVVAVGPGPEIEAKGGIRFALRYVTLQPIEIVKGFSSTALIRFTEPGYTADGTGFTVNQMAWSEKGDEGWFFLENSPEGWLRPVSSYGKFVIDGAAPGPSGLRGIGDPWSGISPGNVLDLKRTIVRF
jgi:hypothetical protein